MLMRRTIARGLWETGLEDAFAAAVARFEGWEGPLGNHRRRVWQTLGEYSDRRPDVDWAVLAVRLFTYHGREDLADALVGALHAAKYEGRRARDEGEALAPASRRAMRRAGGGDRRDRGAA